MVGDSVRRGLILGVAVLSAVLSAEAAIGRAQSVAVGVRSEAVKLAPVNVDVVNAPLADVLMMIAQQAGLKASWNDKVISAAPHISLRVRDVPADIAFARALSGTGLLAVVVANHVNFVKDVASALVAQGSISGKIVDGKTRQPLRGATVLLDNASKGTTSGDDGTFRIANVGPGPHTIRVRLLGYGKAATTVSVVEGQTASVEVALESSVNALDQVVVTGTVIPTELRAIPNAITVITARQIEERGITRIDQLFRGDVPGLFSQAPTATTALDEVVMFSRGASAFGASAGVSTITANTNPIKTYVDGVELADPQYLSQIDPRSIERIEILTGPQASTIYGSNALNGVMQIFTKRGTSSHPQLTVNLLSGWVENSATSARNAQHDYSAQLNGIEGRFAYSAGGSWNYMGPWTPAKRTSRVDGFGGVRSEVPTKAGRVTVDLTLRQSMTQNWVNGDSRQGYTEFFETGWYTPQRGWGVEPKRFSAVTGTTAGVEIGHAPTSWWSQQFGIGQDASKSEARYTVRGYATIADTNLRLQQGNNVRRSTRYTTTFIVPVTSIATATITGGADGWQNAVSSVTISPQTLTGTLTGTTTISRRPEHNTGGFLQTQVGVKDRLFLTYGLRAEWNPNFGADQQPNYAPRYGMAYVQDVGSLTAKVRASYGRSTRPPRPELKEAFTAAEQGVNAIYLADFGNYDYIKANPDLGPEYQQGGEGGLELYWGTRGSLVVTRYNQTVDGLISYVTIDSVRSLLPQPPSKINLWAADGYGYMSQSQYVNALSIRNQGWELQGSVNTGPVTTRGTYSWTKSRVLGSDPRYRVFFTPNIYPQYQPGAGFSYLPEHTWAIGMTYARSQTTVGLNVTGTGQLYISNCEFGYIHLGQNIRLLANRLSTKSVESAGCPANNRGYAQADLTGTRRVSSRVEGLVQIQNLTDYIPSDQNASVARLGRQVKAGFRWR